MTLLLFAACAPIEIIPLHFDGPVAAAVLAEADGPFEEPTGYVANRRSGLIVPLALKQGRLLTDDATASFLRASPIATGRARLLSDVAISGTDDTVTAWAADTQWRQLVQAPYIVGVSDNGVPEEVAPEAGEPVFVDADASGDAPTIDDVEVRAGFTTTETWSIEYDGSRWWAKGSRSGVQVTEPKPGHRWQSDEGELAFVLDGEATTGDRFELSTSTGIVEHDLGGLVMGVLAADDVVYASVLSSPPAIVSLDALTGEELARVALPVDAQPTRLSRAPDGRVFVADGATSVVWTLTEGVLGTIATAAPAVDVAWQGGEDDVGVPFDHLFVAPVGLLRVDVYDLEAGAWIDPNPVTPEVEGVFLGAPVTGLAASAGRVRLQETAPWGAHPHVPTVAVTTATGFVYQLEAATGCAEFDATGPTASDIDDDNNNTIELYDQGATSDANLAVNPVTTAQIVPSTCGGVTRSETWTVVYDSALLAWTVEGTRSGMQANLAYDTERYVSDEGAISFLISPGPLPPTDGDRFPFTTDNGLFVLAGSDDDQDGEVDLAWEYPGRPVAYDYTTGPTGGGWDQVDRRQYLLIPVTNGDIAARVRLDSGETEIYWQ